MTETGLSLGTPHYMSPEQASADRDLSARSDPAAPRGYLLPRISPGGRRVALDVHEGDAPGIWIWDFTAGTLSSFFLGEGSFTNPIWTPTGDRIAYTDVGNRNISWKASNNTGAPEVLLEHPGWGCAIRSAFRARQSRFFT